MLAILEPRTCITAADVREAARHAVAWRREVWFQPRQASPARVEPQPAPIVKLPPSPSSTTRRLVKAILAAAAERYGVKVEDLLGRCRKAKYAHARQIAAYLIRSSTPLSLPQIGKILGGRDHTTILSGVRVIAANGRLLALAEEIASAAQTALAEEEGADVQG